MRRQTYTEDDLRATLRRAAEIATRPSPQDGLEADRRTRALRRAAPLLAVAGILAVSIIPIVLFSTRHDPARNMETSTTPTSSESTLAPSEPVVNRMSLEDLEDLGYPFKAPGAGAQPLITESQALDITHGDRALGLLLVGINHYENPEQDSTSKLTTEWRLTWIVGGPPREVRALSSKLVGSEPKPHTVHDVYFVDALTGEIFRSFAL